MFQMTEAMEHYYVLEPGYHLRGDGAFLPRGGGDMDYSSSPFDPNFIRGGGFFDSLKSIASKAWGGFKKYALPFLKEGGKEVAAAVAKTVVPNIPKYIQAAKDDSIHGLITSAMGDIAPVIKDVVVNKMRGGSMPLSHEKLLEMHEGGFPTTQGGIEGTIESCVANCRPYLRKVLQPLVVKMQLLVDYQTKTNAGDVEGAEEAIRRLYTINQEFAKLKSGDAESDILSLVESMINTALRGAEQQGLLVDERGGSILATIGAALLPKVIDRVTTAGANLLGKGIEGLGSRGGAINTTYGQQVATLFPGKIVVGDDMIRDTVTAPYKRLQPCNRMAGTDCSKKRKEPDVEPGDERGSGLARRIAKRIKGD